MSEYLIQDKTMMTMADHMRRISGTEDDLTGAEIIELFSRTQGVIKTSGEYEAEAIDYDGTVLKLGNYDTGEVYAMPKDANGNDLLEFDCWSATSPITSGYTTVDNNNIQVGAVMKPVNDDLIIGVEIAEANTTITINLNCFNGNVINWGDGTSQTIVEKTSVISHTYVESGHYYIKVPKVGQKLPRGTLPFENDAVIKEVYIPSWLYVWSSLRGLDSLETLVIPNNNNIPITNSVNSFNDLGCNSWSSLKTVIFPRSMAKLLENTLYMVENAAIKNVVLPYGITEIPKYSFSDCSSLNNVVIPNSVTRIGNSAFVRSGLSNIIIPNGVVEIGNSAFIGCNNLIEIKIPGSVTSFGQFIFSMCENLAKIVVEEGVTTIGDKAFCGTEAYYESNGLKTIIFPSTVTSLGNCVFGGQSKLKSLILKSNDVCSITENTFKWWGNGSMYDPSYKANPTIYVPDNLVDAYKTDTNWSTYASRIKPLSEYTEK